MAIRKPTIVVHTTYFPVATSPDDAARDPERLAAVALGRQLYELLTRREQEPLSWGAGVPIRIATDAARIDPGEAEIVVAIPVLGRHAQADEQVRRRVVAAMASWRERGVRTLPVLASPSWRAHETALGVKQLLTEFTPGDDGRNATLDELVLSIARYLSRNDARATRLFVSHAKGDLVATERAAEKIRDHVMRRTTGAKPFFGSVSLLAGEDLDSQIDDNAETGVFVAVRGDSYSSRTWCLRELLKAKRRRIPMLSVEVLTSGEHRSSAYAGNSPTIVWQRSNERAAALVVRAAMIECVRSLLFTAEAARVCELLPAASVVQMARPPELLDIPTLRDGRTGVVIVLHPDPELTLPERAVLQEADKRLRAVTPTTVLSGAIGRAIRAPIDGWKVGLSLSDVADGNRGNGLHDAHLKDATVFLARSLLGTGGAIAYGGDFRQNGFAELLAQLVSAYNQTAHKPADQLHCYLAAQVEPPDTWTHAYTSHHLGRYGALRSLARFAPPEDDAELSRARAALYYSDMRRVMEPEIDARVILGGAAEPQRAASSGYAGRYPGAVEEAWRALAAGHPLYVAGGFGGAAGIVARLLSSSGAPVPELPPELDERSWAADAEWQALVAELDAARADVDRLGLPPTQQELAAAIRTLGQQHLASEDAALRWNGLTIGENQTLFATSDPLTLAALVLKGLTTLATAKATGKLQVELVEGDVTTAADLELLVVPTFSNVEPTGAGAAIERVAGNVVTRSRGTRGPVALGTNAIAADFVYAADLGTVSDALADPVKSAARAIAATAAIANRFGFARIGIVTFLGNVAERFGDIVAAMLDGMRHVPDAQWVWYERDPSRAALLADALTGDRVVFTRVLAPAAVDPDPAPAKSRTHVTVRRDGGHLDIALLVPYANGIAPHLKPALDDDLFAAFSGSTLAPPVALRDMIARKLSLAELLLGGATRALDAIGDSELVIVHDAASSALAFETLSWTTGGEVVTPATRGGIVRHLLRDVPADRGVAKPSHAGKLGVLVIIDPNDNLPSAAREGDAIVAMLDGNADLNVKVESLRKADATVAAVLDAIGDPEIDIVHYCGHAFYRGSGPDDSGLRCADGDLTPAQLRTLAHPPRLAFFNACQAGRMENTATSDPSSLTFAGLFLEAGVDAYLGTLWPVADRSAERFATEVYKQLGAGAELGDAVTAARRALHADGDQDWSNYVLYGDSGFRIVRWKRDRGSVVAGVLPATPSSPPLPPPQSRIEGSVIVATWSFAVSAAPATFAVAVTELIDGKDQIAAIAAPNRVDRRNNWSGGVPIAQWVVTVSLAEPGEGRAFRLRPSAGLPLDVGKADPDVVVRRSVPDPNGATAELRAFRELLRQQPDRGDELIARFMPSADPGELRDQLDSVLDKRALWPIGQLIEKDVDPAAVAAFAAAYNLQLDPAAVADQHFQTKEDWGGYVFASGVPWFTVGGEVDEPLSLHVTPAEMTHPVRPGELGADGSLTVALFSDNANGVHSSAAIAQQVVDSHLPYAFHLGDVYYGGKPDEFRDYFEQPLAPMFDRTDFYMIAGNHEMYGKGTCFNELINRKRADHPRQRQRAESFRICGPGFQLIGLDTMFVDWNAGRMRLADYADDDHLRLLDGWLAERPNDLTVLMTTNQAWDRGSKSLTRLYHSLRKTIAGRVDLWFWGNVHYGALFEPWTFADTGAPARQLIASCIGHGGYPFYTQHKVGELPDGVGCRWLEQRSRFWPTKIRDDVGLNGWCKMKLARAEGRWTVALTYLDWIGRERLRVSLVRDDHQSIRFDSVDESDYAAVGQDPTWRRLDDPAK